MTRVQRWADALEHVVAGPLADACEQPAAVVADGVVAGAGAVEECLDELPRAPRRNPRHRLVAVVAGGDGGSLWWEDWAGSGESDDQEDADAQAAHPHRLPLPECHCRGCLG